MEDKIIELLRKNRIGKEKAVYLAHELLFLFSVSTRLLNETLENINIVMWESYMIKDRSFDRVI